MNDKKILSTLKEMLLYNNMDKKSLEKLTKTQLIDILLNQARVKKPVPMPRKNVKQMVKEYEENIILPPIQFRDDYKPKKPIALPRTKIVN